MKLGLSSAAFYGRMETEEAAAHLRDFPIEVCEIFWRASASTIASLARKRQGCWGR